MNTRCVAFLVATALLVIGALTTVPTARQTTGTVARGLEIPRLPGGKPDLQGIWQAPNAAWADLEDHPARLLGDKKSARLFYPAGLGVVEGGTIPYRQEALATRRENLRNQELVDPMVKCYMPGVPRVMYLQVPFQIFQTSRYVTVISEYAHSLRQIYTNGTNHVEGIEFWMGDSRGRWEGDTLVVDTTNFNDRTWFDMAGNFHSEALHVVERITLDDVNTLRYEATIEDSKVFTRPWKISMPIYRVQPSERTELLEFECADILAEEAGIQINPSEEPPSR